MTTEIMMPAISMSVNVMKMDWIDIEEMDNKMYYQLLDQYLSFGRGRETFSIEAAPTPPSSPTASTISAVSETTWSKVVRGKIMTVDEDTDDTEELAPIMLVCKKCPNEFMFSVNQQITYKQKGYDNPKFCVSCKNQRNLDKMINCNVCRKSFSFTQKQQQTYKEKGYAEPKCCRECKSKKNGK